MTPAKILVVDDDQAIRTLIHRYLSQQDYQVESAGDGKSALASFDKFKPELIVLDVNLPDTTGFQLCQEMQCRTDVFVVMLTSLTGEADRLKGLKHADDFITKPFSLVELGARVKAVLKRSRSVTHSEPENLSFSGDLIVNPVSREVTIKGKLISLTALEFDLLYCLASQPDRAWRRAELIQEVWDYEYVGDDLRVVDVHVGKIRKKIEPEPENPTFIKTVRRFGYKFVAPKAPE